MRYDGIAILGHNSPEWFMAELAAMCFGGKAAGIYPTDTPEQIKFKSLLSGNSLLDLLSPLNLNLKPQTLYQTPAWPSLTPFKPSKNSAKSHINCRA